MKISRLFNFALSGGHYYKFSHFAPSLIFICLLLNSALVFPQDNVGIGVTELNYNSNSIIEFYDATDGIIVKRLSFYNVSDSIIPYDKKHYKEINWIIPENGLEFDGDGFINHFVLRCRSYNEKWFEVIVNKDFGYSYWIQKEDVTKFKTWDEYLKSMLIVRRINMADEIYSAPSVCASKTKYDGLNCFRVVEVKGDWIKVIRYLNCSTNFEVDENPIGWIKWKENDKLLIGYDLW